MKPLQRKDFYLYDGCTWADCCVIIKENAKVGDEIFKNQHKYKKKILLKHIAYIITLW